MSDAISRAANIANSAQGAVAKAEGTADAINKAKDLAAKKLDAATSAIDSIDNALENLPTIPDPELIRREQEARILEEKARLDEILATNQEELIENIKSKLKSLALAQLPQLPRLPMIDPKILGAVAIARQIKELANNRKKLAEKYLSQGEKVYDYPITPRRSRLPTRPETPSLPTPPTIPPLPIKKMGR